MHDMTFHVDPTLPAGWGWREMQACERANYFPSQAHPAGCEEEVWPGWLHSDVVDGIPMPHGRLQGATSIVSWPMFGQTCNPPTFSCNSAHKQPWLPFEPAQTYAICTFEWVRSVRSAPAHSSTAGSLTAPSGVPLPVSFQLPPQHVPQITRRQSCFLLLGCRSPAGTGRAKRGLPTGASGRCSPAPCIRPPGRLPEVGVPLCPRTFPISQRRTPRCPVQQSASGRGGGGEGGGGLGLQEEQHGQMIVAEKHSSRYKPAKRPHILVHVALDGLNRAILPALVHPDLQLNLLSDWWQEGSARGGGGDQKLCFT